jgi:nitroreductase
MDIYEAIRNRRSVRSFSPAKVKEEKLERIFQAVRLAPSARNAQEWRFVVVRNPATRVRLAEEAAEQPFIGQAPVVIACCAQTDGRVMRCGQTAYPIDVAIAADHLTLAAAAEGLGTCWIGSFDEGAVKRILNIPPMVRVVLLMPLGYAKLAEPEGQAAGTPHKMRRSLSEILHDEKW